MQRGWVRLLQDQASRSELNGYEHHDSFWLELLYLFSSAGILRRGKIKIILCISFSRKGRWHPRPSELGGPWGLGVSALARAQPAQWSHPHVRDQVQTGCRGRSTFMKASDNLVKQLVAVHLWFIKIAGQKAFIPNSKINRNIFIYISTFKLCLYVSTHIVIDYFFIFGDELLFAITLVFRSFSIRLKLSHSSITLIKRPVRRKMLPLLYCFKLCFHFCLCLSGREAWVCF